MTTEILTHKKKKMKRARRRAKDAVERRDSVAKG